MVNMKSCALLLFLITLPYLMGITTALQCGTQTGQRCDRGNCCSQFGWCGSTYQYCGNRCQRGYGYCWSPATIQAIADAEAEAQAQAWAQTQAIQSQAAQAEAQVEPARAGAP